MNQEQSLIENKTVEITLNGFYNKIKEFEGEAYVETYSSYEDSIKGIREQELANIAAWVARQYFSEKNKDDYWYSADINEDNVLRFISDSKNGFPHTLSAVIEQFKLNKSLRATLTVMYNDTDEQEYECGINMVGEKTLKDIGAVVGNVTPTMVNKITDKAMEKYKKIYELYHSSVGPRFVKYYNNLIEDMADFFAIAFTEEETLEDAIAFLVSENIIKQKDLNYLEHKDFIIMDKIFHDAKQMLFSEVEDMFINDFNGERKISLFQYAISRSINPDEKSGRKKNETT